MVDLKVATLDGASATISEESVAEFSTRMRGQVIQPDDDAYEQARMVWNGNIDRRPALIAQCNGVGDVIDSVNFARENNLRLAIRGGAHSAAGYGTCDGGIVIDLSGMKGIQVDPEKRTARAQAGVQWGDLDKDTQAFGLATAGGIISNTGIAGLTLGGGLGWLMGKHGLSIDNVLSFDLVTADGKFLKASENENADLFWGLRGGGGNFGIVTSFEYRLHPVGPMVLGGLMLHPFDKAKEVLQFYREFSSNLPDEADAYAGMLTSPEGQPVVALILGYNGPIEEGEKVLAPAREFGEPLADLVQPMPYMTRQSMLDDPMAIHGIQRYWKSGFTKTLDDELLDVLIGAASSFSSPMTQILFFNIHGAATRVPLGDTAFGSRESKWDFNIITQWTDAAESDRHIAWTRSHWSQIEEMTDGSAYINHIAGDDKPDRVPISYGENYSRLVSLKQKYDPQNLFRINPNIKP